MSSFRLDKYLVTVGRFREFVAAWEPDAGAYMPAPGSGKHTYLTGGGLNLGSEPGWVASDDSNVAPTDANLACSAFYATWTSSGTGNENLPISCVNWYEAYAFCIWDGGFLPSEAEWELAASGGSEQREYPWGSTAPGMACPGAGCEYAIYNCDYPNGSAICTGLTNIAPVGTASSGLGVWGQLDLVGDMNEWNLDSYQSSYVDPCSDCANLAPPTYRVLRGGNFTNPATNLLPPDRLVDPPTSRGGGIGFRCARTSVGADCTEQTGACGGW